MTTAPWWNNAEKTEYTNLADMAVEGMNAGTAQVYAPAFTNYVEGIYVGYKYYETAVQEGAIDYDKTVQYPFGYGLSYTESVSYTHLERDFSWLIAIRTITWTVSLNFVEYFMIRNSL